MAAPWDGRLSTYLGYGLASARPTTPNIAPGLTAVWYSTDTSELSLWVSGAWVEDAGGSGAPELDLYGSDQGDMLFRGSTSWEALPTETSSAYGYVLRSAGGASDPSWSNVSDLLDDWTGGANGDLLMRGPTIWESLHPGVAGQVLTTNGAGSPPSWEDADTGLPDAPSDGTLYARKDGDWEAVPTAGVSYYKDLLDVDWTPGPTAGDSPFWDGSKFQFRPYAPASNFFIVADEIEILGGGGFDDPTTTFGHADSGVTPGAYGSGYQVPRITVNARGHVTGITPVTITGTSIGSNAWQPMASWDFAVSGTNTTGVVAAVGNYNEVRVFFQGVTTAASAWRVLFVSTDGGVTYYNTSGNYVELDGAGAPTNQRAFFSHTTNTSNARGGMVTLTNALDSNVKICELNSRGGVGYFIGSTSPITHVMAMGWNNSALVNMTGGSVRIEGR